MKDDLMYIKSKIEFCFRYLPREQALRATERLRRLQVLLEAPRADAHVE